MDLNWGGVQVSENAVRSGKYGQIDALLLEEFDFRYNVISARIEYKKKDEKSFIQVSENDFNDLRRYLDANGCKTSQDELKSTLKSSFSKNYNPFIEYLYSLETWDGYDHIGDLAFTVEVTNQDYFEICLTKWLVAVIASMMEDDVVNQHVLVLIGDQGVGKTTWLKKLCPKELEDYVYNGYVNTMDKDSLIMLSESLIINVDEMDALTKKQMEQFKELITKPSVRIRRPYGLTSENLPRRASFCASLNNKEFLNDPTGSRRFLVHDVLTINNKHGLDINQVFAHAFSLYLSGERYWFDENETNLINTVNKNYQVEYSEEELLLNNFEPADENSLYLSSTEIVQLIQQDNIGITLNINTMGKMLTKNGFSQVNHKSRKKWKVKRVSSK